MQSFSIRNEKGYGKLLFKASLLSIALIPCISVYAQSDFKSKFGTLIQPNNGDSFKAVSLQEVSKSQFVSPFEPIQNKTYSGNMTALGAVIEGLKQHPSLSSSISSLISQNDYLRVAKSSYYPQLSSEYSTGDFSSNNRGDQLLTLSATQMLYDFGKTKASVDAQEAKMIYAQIEVLKTIDDLSFEILTAIINVIRYEELSNIATLQLKGVSRIRDIAKMRVDAGISSQADFIQATTYYQNAQSNEIMQRSLLVQWKDKLSSLLGGNISTVKFTIPDAFVQQSNLYESVDYKTIPQVMLANTKILQTSAEKKALELSQYPTLNVIASVSQAVNGINSNNGKDKGTDSAIMFKASSSLYQGGATQARKNALSSVEQAAKADLRAVYLDINTNLNNIREVVQQSQAKINILDERAKSSRLTKELYQEQYTLGKRTILDLLNAEQDIYTTYSERETVRSDVYQQLAQFIKITGRSRDVYGLNGVEIQGFKVEK